MQLIKKHFLLQSFHITRMAIKKQNKVNIVTWFWPNLKILADDPVTIIKTKTTTTKYM